MTQKLYLIYSLKKIALNFMLIKLLLILCYIEEIQKEKLLEKTKKKTYNTSCKHRVGLQGDEGQISPIKLRS